jgi:hypothetical protein
VDVTGSGAHSKSGSGVSNVEPSVSAVIALDTYCTGTF